MKYKDANFTKWMDAPSQEVFDAWVAMRKTNKAPTSQIALNRASKFLNLLFERGYSADLSLSIACDLGWKGLEWVYNAEQKKGFPEGRISVDGLPSNVTSLQPQKTIDLSVHDQLTNRDWAD